MSINKVQTISRNGRKEFAVLPYADFLKLRSELEDYEDLRCLREARDAEVTAATVGLTDVKQRLLKRTPTGSASGKPRH
jgi:hypothetical protein